MNKILAKANLAMRSSILERVGEPCSGYMRNGFLHISIESKGCRYRNAGHCTMCDYGEGDSISEADVTHYMEKVWNESCDPVCELLVGSCGSIFDTDEISTRVLNAILQFLVMHPISSVIFETHYTTVTSEVLNHLKNILDGSIGDIFIEMGLESADPYILKNSINKHMNLSELRKKIDLIKSFGISSVLNVFLGAPFLTPMLQLTDAEHAIQWAFENGADGVVVFPSNIKCNTLIGYLYDRGRYKRLSAWLLVELLNRASHDILGKIELSWYGDRQKLEMAKNVLPPYACDKCDDSLQEFFMTFNTMRSNADARRELIDGLLNKSNICRCYDEMKISLEQPSENTKTLVSRELKLLAKELNLTEDF